MNNPTDEESVTESAAEYCAEVDQCVRRNPTAAILVAVGVGLAIGLLVRALRPEPSPRNRIVQLLEDIECRLRDSAEPAIRKVSALASDGSNAFHDSLHSGEARIERLIREARQRIRKILF